MTTSSVGICNRALQLLGANAITALSDSNSKSARECNRAYDSCRQMELRAHPWNFATKRAQLAASVTAPDFGKTNYFDLPSDFIRLLPPDSTENYNDRDWKIEGRQIVTDYAAPLEIRYTADIEDVPTMDTLFREVLAHRIAVEICEAITQSNTKSQILMDGYRGHIVQARRVNAFENIAEDPPEDDWITVRY